MIMTDGKKTVKLEIRRWNGTGYDPDWSEDFFNAATLTYDEDREAFVVEDVDSCIDWAMSTNPNDGARFRSDDDGNAVFDEDMDVIVTEI